jgi:hypothetical protein
MAQAHVDYIKNSKAIQTEPIPAFSIQLDKNKTAKRTIEYSLII